MQAIANDSDKGPQAGGPWRRVARAGVAVAVLACLVGLVWAGWTNTPGLRTYRVTGTVTRDGKQLVWRTKPNLLVVLFSPEDREADPNIYKAEADPVTGAYEITDVPAGKYIVAVQQFDATPHSYDDLLGHHYNLPNTTLRYEVKGNDVHDIDIPKGLPTGAVGPGGPPGGGGGGRRGGGGGGLRPPNDDEARPAPPPPKPPEAPPQPDNPPPA